jgi:hypothetical protein
MKQIYGMIRVCFKELDTICYLHKIKMSLGRFSSKKI